MCFSPLAQGESLSYADILRKLTDLEGLALLPEPGERCAQFSSYNRASRYDAQTGKYVNWDLDGDQQGVLREEGDAAVLAEMKGPGCIWRIWSAAPMSGHVKVYLDGAAEPAVDLPFKDYFDLNHFPFVYPSLVHVTGLGCNSYLPIPYQESCKVVAEKGWGAFYHITYGTFPQGTTVPTFSLDLAKRNGNIAEAIDAFLSSRLDMEPAGTEGRVTDVKAFTLRPRERVTVVELKGTGAVTALGVKMESRLSAAEAAAFLREAYLQISWDGEQNPSVWAPLGDFFGTTPSVNHYKSLPLGMTEEGFYSHWYMPYAKSALIEIGNEGNSTCRLEVSVTHAPLSRPVEELGRFHAKWHRDAFLPIEPERAIDWTILKTQGRGRYCGVMLHVWNPEGGWWGEGDEKFFVDGEKFPSTFGTGSEDYFGYAWSMPDFFENAYHNQTFNRARNRGHVSVNRWHMQDNVPFQTSFEGSIEKYFGNERPTMYAATAYWYLSADGTDPYKPVPVEERTGYYDYLLPSVGKDQTVFDAQLLHLVRATGGEVRMIHHFGSTREESYVFHSWEGARPGDKLVFETLPLKDAGVYNVEMRFTKGPGCGVVQLYLDNAKIGKPVDLQSDEFGRSDWVLFGPLTFGRGPHNVTMELLGADENRSRFGLQCVNLRWAGPPS